MANISHGNLLGAVSLQPVVIYAPYSTLLGATSLQSEIAQHTYQRPHLNGKNDGPGKDFIPITAEGTNQTIARSRAAAKDQKLLSEDQRRLLTNAESEGQQSRGEVPATGSDERHIASIHLAKEGLQIERQREIEGRMPYPTTAQVVASIPPHKRATYRENLQSKVNRPFPRGQQHGSHVALGTYRKLYMNSGQQIPMLHARVRALKNLKAAEHRKGHENRSVLKRRRDARSELLALNEIEARARKHRQLKLMARGWIEEEDDSREYTLQQASEASTVSATPRGGLEWDAVGARTMDKVGLKGWVSESMPKKKSPLSNEVLA